MRMGLFDLNRNVFCPEDQAASKTREMHNFSSYGEHIEKCGSTITDLIRIYM